LTKELRGDLDWVVMKALEKSRTRRYGTPAELAADVSRFLSYEPVLAGPPSATYKLRKLVRRNRGAVTAVVVVLLSLAGGFAWAMTERQRALQNLETAEGERERADAEAEEARTQAKIAETVNEFLNEDLLASVSPDRAGVDVTVRQVVEEAAKRVGDGRFEAMPLVEASIRETLGITLRELGVYGDATPHAERAVEIRRAALGDEDPNTLVSMANLALLYKVQSKYEEAERLLLQALEPMKRILGEEDPRTLTAMDNLALLYQSQGRYEEAEPLSVQALEARKRVLGNEHLRTLTSMNNLALLYKWQKRYEEAERLYVQKLEISRRVFGEEHPDTLVSMANLAVLYEYQRKLEKAEPLHLQVLEAEKKILGEEHPDTLISMHNLAAVYEAQARFSDAEAMIRPAVDTARRTLGEHLYTGLFACRLGTVLGHLDRHDEAETILIDAHRIISKVVGPDHRSSVRATEGLVQLYEAWDKPKEAEKWRAKLPKSVGKGAGEE
jgi:tetratricopeptide (TPR) repeat protein